MTLIDGDRIVTAQLYDDEHEEFTEQKMRIIDYVNAYTDEGVTTADDVLDKISHAIEVNEKYFMENVNTYIADGLLKANKIIDKYRKGQE